MHWRDIWAWLHTWQGYVPTSIALATALYYGPQKVLETWDWYLNRFLDEDVLDVLRDRRFAHSYDDGIGPIQRPPVVPIEIPYGENEIASKLSRTVKSVKKSLQRLRKKGKANTDSYGWKIVV